MAPSRTPTSPRRDLEQAATLLMVAGFVSALLAGGHALGRGGPLSVIAAVVTVVLVGVAGWLVVAVGDRSLPAAATLAVLGSLAGFALLAGPALVLEGGFLGVIVLPALVLLSAFAAGEILGFALAGSLAEIPWRVRGGPQARLLLLAAAVPTVWTVFLAFDAARPAVPVSRAGAALALGGLGALLAVAAGRLIDRGGHPRHALLGALGPLGIDAAFVVQLTGPTPAGAGLPAAAWAALAGLLLAAFPVAYTAVAYYDLHLAADDDLDRTRPLA